MSESQIIVPRQTETLNGVTTASPVEERDVQAKSKRRLRTAAAAAALGKDCGGASFARPSDHRDEGRETAAVHHGTCEPRAVGLFECDYCGGTFKWKSSLSRHFRTHTGERPYACEVCGKVFTQHANLVRHRRTHTGERPYACGKTFRMKASLVAHNRSHTGANGLTRATCAAKHLCGAPV